MVTKKNKKLNIKKTDLIKWYVFVLLSSLVIFGIEMFSYACIAIWFGKMWYPNPQYVPGEPDPVLNLQTPFDKWMPWCSWIFPYYISWAFTWPIIIPLVVYAINGGYKKNGKDAYMQYLLNSFFMYIISTILYALIPTTCRPAEFIDQLDPSSPFYNQIKDILVGDDLNIFGSCPSYHNYWASLFVFFGAKNFFNKNKIKTMTKFEISLSIISIAIGIMITFSTLTLHQHNLIDVIVTYSLTLTIALIIAHYNIVDVFKNWLNKSKLNINI